MKKHETQSLALDGFSQVSLSITRTSFRPFVPKLRMHPLSHYERVGGGGEEEEAW